MKLVIQIPAYNEEETLEQTLKDIPDYIEGIDEIVILVVDDGSQDKTAFIAEKFGAKVVSHIKNMGLATAFATGINNALEMGADIIVNTDADNQYQGQYIQNLIKPIVEKQADMVIGARPVEHIPYFSPLKKILQKTGSYAVKLVSSVTVPDAPSGFRALSREAAMKINIFSKYTYTLETIIQAGMKDISVKWVPVEVNPPLRPSRLLKSNFSYILKSVVTIFRMFLLYRSFRFFAFFGSFIFFLGTLFGFRFLFYYIQGAGDGHVQSLILASVLLITGFQTFLIGIVTDLTAANRRLLENIRFVQKKNRYENKGNNKI